MDLVVKIIGIVIVLIAIAYFLKPGVIKWLMEFFKKGNRIYFAGLIRFAMAIVFFVAAGECKNFWVILTFGILFLISGLLIFVMGPGRLRPIFEWAQNQSAFVLRMLALVAFAVGVVIIIYA
ncbi:MAG TPA: hypothetical protein VMW16_08460 [Sedimentisphaerales bacterium]|nr:hypothetical protein [Sedimentisphaerales bacterium]